MKPVSLIRRSIGIACSALILTGLLCAPVSAANDSYVSVGDTAIVNVNSLNIRTGPGTQYATCGMLTDGYSVRILQIQDGWGYIDGGWIDLDYVTSGRRGSSSASGTGYVTADALNIRSGPGTNYERCGMLTNGYKVNILEYSGDWGRIDSGWINLKYVGDRPNGNSILKGSQVKVIANQLNIREGAGTGYRRVGTYNYGDRAEILDVRGSWGRTNRGWICLDFTTYISSTNNTSPAYHSISAGDRVEVTATSLNIRAGAGMNYERRGMLTQGYRVLVEEVNGTWGRIDSGWICLDYVRAV